MDISERLKELRINKGLSQEELGEIIGVSASAIGMFEQGRRFPRKETLEALCDYFNVGTDYLTAKEDRTTRYVDPYYADLIDHPLIKRLMLAGGKLPDESLEPFVLAIEAAVKACSKQ